MDKRVKERPTAEPTKPKPYTNNNSLMVDDVQFEKIEWLLICIVVLLIAIFLFW